MNTHSLILASLLLLPTVAPAAPAAATPMVGQTLNSFEQDSARIRSDMQPGGKYGYISNIERSRVEDRLADMQKLLAAHADAADMQPSDKVALLNAQDDNNRLVCEHVAPVGSHRPITTCHTYAEIMQQRERNQHDMERRLSTPQLKSGN
jgi:hypothetical protein